MLDRLAMVPLSSSSSMAGLSTSSKSNAVCKTSQRGGSIRCELNQRVMRRTGTQKVSSQPLLSVSVLHRSDALPCKLQTLRSYLQIAMNQDRRCHGNIETYLG